MELETKKIEIFKTRPSGLIFIKKYALDHFLVKKFDFELTILRYRGYTSMSALSTHRSRLLL